jgi:hypothetical protein
VTTPQPAPFDPGNPYLGETPTHVTYAVVDTPGGQRLAITFRTPSTTFTVFADKANGQSWHRMMGQQLDRMSSIQVVPASGLPLGRPGV